MAMLATELFGEAFEVMGVEHADSQAAGQHAINWFYAGQHHKFVFLLDVGDMAQGATLDMVIREATSAAGTNTQNIAGKAITQLTQAGGDGDDFIIVELDTSEMTPGWDWLSPLVTIANDAVEYSLVCLGAVARYGGPVPLTNVTEHVN